MKLLAFVLCLGLNASAVLADDVPQLKAIEARYDQSQLTKDEALRAKYVTELAGLRWSLARQGQTGWQEVDAEIALHPVLPGTTLPAQLRVGPWISPRHDYLFRADGTWVMDPDPNDANTTHGTWALQGSQYTESVAEPEKASSYTIILLDAQNFIYANSQYVFYERRPGKEGWPLRRDD